VGQNESRRGKNGRYALADEFLHWREYTKTFTNDSASLGGKYRLLTIAPHPQTSLLPIG
jgi:hypothetical protein